MVLSKQIPQPSPANKDAVLLLEKKVALVTGGGSGIGEAVAKLYAAYGAMVVVSDINTEGGNRVVDVIRKHGGAAVFIEADVSNATDCQKLVDDTVKYYKRLDIACNNAGIGGEISPIADMTLEGWHKVISINLNSVFYCMKFEIPALLKSGGGCIVNMASVLGMVGFAGSAAYVTAKHGVIGLTQTATLEYASKGIRINAVGPGFIQTPLLNSLDEESQKAIAAQHPVKRLGDSREVAELVAWLSSDKATFVNGGFYPVDGGYLAK